MEEGKAESEARLLPLLDEKDERIAELEAKLASITAQQEKLSIK